MLIINSVSDVRTEKARKDKKVQRQYFSVTFADANNPFAEGRTRNFFQRHNADGTEANWGVVKPTTIKGLQGKQVPGRFATFKTEPYEIIGSDGQARMVNMFSCVVLPHEEGNIPALLKNLGNRTLAVDTTSVEKKAENTKASVS